MKGEENFRIGTIEYSKGNYEEALKYYQKSIEESPLNDKSYYNSGVCYIKLKNFEKAIFFLKSAINLNQADSRYYFNLGYSYFGLKNIKQAYIYLNVAYSLDNEDEDCKKAIQIIESQWKEAV